MADTIKHWNVEQDDVLRDWSQGRLNIERAAQLLHMPYSAFLSLAAKRGVTALDQNAMPSADMIADSRSEIARVLEQIENIGFAVGYFADRAKLVGGDMMDAQTAYGHARDQVRFAAKALAAALHSFDVAAALQTKRRVQDMADGSTASFSTQLIL